MNTRKGSEIMDEIHRLERMGFGIGSRIHRLLEENLEGKILVDEAELREIMSKVKPQRDVNEYNVYHFCKLLLGES